MNNDIRVTSHGADLLPIDSLLEFQGNLKTITPDNLERLKRSILKHGFSAPIFVWKGVDNHILDGHQRLKALLALRQEGYEIPLLPVVYVDADSEAHAKEKLLYITSQYGSFDREGFADFTEGLDLSFEDIRLTDGEFFAGSFTEDESVEDEDADQDDKYTSKVESPVYEPKGEKPKLTDLFDTKKYNDLVEAIGESNIPDEEKAFLVVAAGRHVVFNYSNIANYYAHSDSDMQRLMEDSALVIIDFDKAIEQGYVKLAADIDSYYNEANGA